MSARCDAAMMLVEHLLAEPRLATVQACDDATVVVRVDVPDLAADRLNPTLLCHRRVAEREWKVAWSSVGTVAALGADAAVAYVRLSQGAQELRLRDAMDRDVLVHRFAGNVAALAFDADGKRLACTVLDGTLCAVDRPDALGGSDAVWFNSQRASLGRARRMQGQWRVWLLEDGARALPLTLPEGGELTGELAWLCGGQLVLGVTYFEQDGGQRFGFLVVDALGRLLREIRDEHIDLSAPVAAPDGARLACLGTTLPADGGHMVQHPCLLSPAGVLSSPAPAGELWLQPRGWVGARRLVCLADDGAQRRLYLLDLECGAVECVDVDGSVLDVACGGPCIGLLASAPARAPALLVVDTGAVRTSSRILMHSSVIALPGTARHVAMRDHAVSGPLGAWLCTPHGDPAAGLIVMFHGGPLKSWTDWAWRWNPWPFVAAGFTVALVEPPMSLGYGDAAIATGWRRWRTGIGAVAVRQVETLREDCGLGARPLALMGGSFGGYLALVAGAALRPRLVVTHGCPLDLAQVAASTDVAWQWLREYGDPQSRGADYAEQSFGDVGALGGTRVLVSHGLHDDLVAPSESLRFHRAMLRAGGRSELAIFTGERHALLKPENLRAWYRWVLQACDEELRGAQHR
jgi:dipeptidyl aminopeptidase/acylaminoacyl peptidase